MISTFMAKYSTINDHRDHHEHRDDHHHCSYHLIQCIWFLMVIALMTSRVIVVDSRTIQSLNSDIINNDNDDLIVECTLANFQQCIAGLWSNNGGSTSTDNGGGFGDLAFPTTAEQLQLTCMDLKRRVRCLDRHSERCFTHEMMQVFGHIVTNAKQFVHDLCDDHKVQAEYLIHAKCFRNISLDEHKCGQEYRDAITLPINRNQRNKRSSSSMTSTSTIITSPNMMIMTNDKEMIMRRSCCALQELVLCKRRHVREQCGQSASIFMRDHLPRITNPVLEQHCQAYTYGPSTCDEALYGQHGRLIDHDNDRINNININGDNQQQQLQQQQQQQTYLIRPLSDSTQKSSIIWQRQLTKLNNQHLNEQQQMNIEDNLNSRAHHHNFAYFENNLLVYIHLVLIIIVLLIC